MSQTVRELISEITENVKAKGVDKHLPGKYIHKKAQGIAALFIKRDADSGRLFAYTDAWATIGCMDMIEEDLIKCCNVQIPNCTTVCRSKEKLPKAYTSRFGYLMVIYALDIQKTYTLTTPENYISTLSREYKDPDVRYAWIENDYLVTPHFTKKVRIQILALNKADAIKLNCTCDERDCVSVLDQEFTVPEHLLDNVKDKLTIDILKTNGASQADELTNLNENEKNDNKH